MALPGGLYGQQLEILRRRTAALTSEDSEILRLTPLGVTSTVLPNYSFTPEELVAFLLELKDTVNSMILRDKIINLIMLTRVGAPPDLIIGDAPTDGATLLQEAGTILDLKLSREDATEFKLDLLLLASRVAQASGQYSGWLDRLTGAEKKAVMEVASALRIPTDIARQYIS